MCFTSAVISSRYCYLYTSKNNNRKGCISTTSYVIMFTQPCMQASKFLCSVKPWRVLYSVILCLDLQKPARVQQQQHLSMLSFVGVISMRFHLRCCRINCTKCPGIHEATCIGNTHIFATNFMGLEQIFIAGGNDKKEPKPKTLVTFMIEHGWALKGFTPSWKKVLLSGSADKWLGRNVWTCGPFGPTYPVGGAGHKHTGVPKHTR